MDGGRWIIAGDNLQGRWDRSYRRALAHEDALAEIRRVTGPEFDPRCVEAFLASIGEAEEQAA